MYGCCNEVIIIIMDVRGADANQASVDQLLINSEIYQPYITFFLNSISNKKYQYK